MEKKALILHAWYSKPDSNWYPWLKKHLEEKGYIVFVPKLPTMSDKTPDPEKQIAFIDSLLKVDGNTTVIGHSLGCPLGLRLAEKRKMAKLVLVAGWDYDDLFEDHRLYWKNKLDHGRIKENAGEIFCVSSDNDPYVTAFTAEEMSKRLGGKFILIKHGGHFGTKEKCFQLPQLLPLI